MNVLIDTSAIVSALLNDDPNHAAAANQFEQLIRSGPGLVSHHLASVETIAVLQRKSGLPAVRDFVMTIEPMIDVVWVDDLRYRRALAALLGGPRRVSLVDWISFDLMRERQITTAFTFDREFTEQGFDVVPGS